MQLIKSSDDPRKNAIRKLLGLYEEIKLLNKKALDESLRRDYSIYINDIRRFLEQAPSKNLEEIQVYIDDYQAVIDIGKTANIPYSAQG